MGRHAKPNQGAPWPVTRVSLHADAPPPSGIVDPPFRWDDLLEEERPGAEERGPPLYCIPMGELLVGGTRLENTVLVMSYRESGAIHIEVEDRLCVTERALAGAIETERAGVGARIEVRRSHHERRATDLRMRARTAWSTRFFTSVLLWLRASYHGIAATLLETLRGVTRGFASLPDRLGTHTRRASDFLSTPDGRRRFRRGLLDPHSLSGEQKAVTLFVGISTVLATLVVLHFLVTLVFPQFAIPWRTAFFLFLYGYVSSLGVPLPVEPALLAAALSIGRILTIAITVTAKVLAAWMVFFLGDEVNERMRKRAKDKPWFGRFLSASERFARRFGIFAVAAFLVVPGLPDAIALYIFGSLHMKLHHFLFGVALGGLILYTAVLFGLFTLLGIG